MARPAQFNHDEVLEKAMQAFWDQGYCATSMSTLVEVTDLKPGSLYAAFESKQGLFLASLDHYANQRASQLRLALNEAESPLKAIRDYFFALADKIDGADNKRSCLLVNSVLEIARRDAEVQQHIKAHMDTMESIFTEALTHARDIGELPADRDITDTAAFLMSNIWGLRVLAGVTPAAGRARKVVEQLLFIL